MECKIRLAAPSGDAFSGYPRAQALLHVACGRRLFCGISSRWHQLGDTSKRRRSFSKMTTYCEMWKAALLTQQDTLR